MESTQATFAIGKNRSRAEIAAIILSVARNAEPQIRIMEEARLSSQRLRFYLSELTKSGLIEISYANGKRVYVTSQKGIQYLTQYSALTKLLK